MTRYSYIARDSTSRILRGEIVAQSTVELRSQLNAMELQLVSYDTGNRGRGLELLKSLSPQRWLPVRSRDIELVLRQLAIMLRSGLKLLDALKALQLQAEPSRLSKLLEKIHDSIARGKSLSSALAAHRAFPTIVIQLVNIGEQTGNLDLALRQSNEYLTQRRTMLTEIRVAISYPLVVTLAAISVAAYLVLYVIPQLQTFLSAMGRDLPAMTQTLIDFSEWIKINGLSLVMCSVSCAAGLAILMYTKHGRLALDRCLLRFPILGETLRLSGTTGLASSLAIMLKSGIRLVPALQIATNTQNNRYLASLTQSAGYSVACGNPLAPALAVKHGFSPILSSMIEIAERAGNIDGTLGEVALLCEAELKSKIKRMSQLVEPVVILLAGGTVGYVYIAFFVALISAGGGVR